MFLNTFKEKLHQAILPHLMITIAATIVFDILYYFMFVANTPWISKINANFLVPIAYAAIIQLTILLPFINKFELAPKQNRFSINVLSMIVVCVPVIVSVPLVSKLSSKVIRVENVYDITNTTKGNCFHIKNIALDTGLIGESFWTESKKPKNSRRYTELNIVLAAPITDGRVQSNKSIHWLYRSYSRREKSTAIPEGEIEDFKAECYTNFKSGSTVGEMVYAERIPENWIGNHTHEAINDRMYDQNASSFIVFEPHYKTLAAETLRQALFLLLAFAGSGLFWSISIWSAKRKKQYSHLKKGDN